VKLAPGERIVDDEMFDLTFDRFGRLWSMGGASLAIVEAGGTR
jgi:hypothetical protein